MVFCTNNPAINKGSLLVRPVACERCCRRFSHKIGFNPIRSMDLKIWIY
jgi:hypothetical protein